MNDKQKQIIAISCAVVAVIVLGLEFFKQYQDNLPRGPMAPATATGNKGAWVRAQKEGKAAAPGSDQDPAAR